MFKPDPNPEHPDAILFAVSDATGETARHALQAALTQFSDVNVELKTISEIRTPAQIETVVAEAAQVGAVIAHTLVVGQMRRLMDQHTREHGVPAIDLMGPVLACLEEVFGRAPAGRPGLLDSESIKRAEAMSFTVKHDDGQRPQDLPQAEIVLVGASRTSKTPISVYLSYHGWRAANIPITLGADPPKELFEVNPRRVIGLTIEPVRLQMLRRVRVRHLGVNLPDYTDLSMIRLELMHVLELCHENGWRVVNVTDRSVEEAAVEIINLVEQRSRFASYR
ncbi:MAG: kinase/pyrophosphorylase [Chloroflexi bacterium]|nr:MAG: kinase/pyrophosphorylase [Chloroflexota bacterium]